MGLIPDFNWNVIPAHRYFCRNTSHKVAILIEDLGYVYTDTPNFCVSYYGGFRIHTNGFTHEILIRKNISHSSFYAVTLHSIFFGMQMRLHDVFRPVSLNYDYFYPNRQLNPDEAFEYVKRYLKEVFSLRDMWGTSPYLDMYFELSGTGHIICRADDEQYEHVCSTTKSRTSALNGSLPIYKPITSNTGGN